jgi:RNA polymerase sigma factor (sigma-70 family)
VDAATIVHRMIDPCQDEKTLLESLKSSDSRRRNRGYECLFDRHADYLVKLLQRFGAQLDEAEDLIQEVFIKVVHAITEFRGESSLRTWLRRITVRIWIDRLRQRKAKPRGVPIDELDGEDGGTTRDTLRTEDEVDPLNAAALLQFTECVEQGLGEFGRRHPVHAAALRRQVTPDGAAAPAAATSMSRGERQRLYEARKLIKPFISHCRPDHER